MCVGISVSWRDLTDNLIAQHGLHERKSTRTPETEPEIHFLYRDRKPLLPVWHCSELLIVPWGIQNNRGTTLPVTGWAKLESVEAGNWLHFHPVPVEIPARYGLDRNVWFHIPEGVRGILVHDERGGPHVYLLTQPASHYYQVMTRNERMPVFIGQGV